MITKAPWIIKGQDIIGNEPNGYICTWSGKIANAQAISCLPDLIEAIQEAYLQLQVHCDTNTAFTNDWRVMNIIKSVLLKAGQEVGK